MAVREHSCTRRALLGAAVAVPVAGGVGASPRLSPASGSGGAEARAWRRALAAFRRREIAREGFGELTSAASAGPGGRSFEAQEALDERLSRFAAAADAALLRLLAAPAPDLGALAAKIALIADRSPWELSGGEECIVWLEADARRLAARG